jgi:hypothetical protein
MSPWRVVMALPTGLMRLLRRLERQIVTSGRRARVAVIAHQPTEQFDTGLNGLVLLAAAAGVNGR